MESRGQREIRGGGNIIPSNVWQLFGNRFHVSLVLLHQVFQQIPLIRSQLPAANKQKGMQIVLQHVIT